MAEKFIIVYRSYDPILTEHLGEMLREAGIVARVIGTRDAAGIGVGPSINQLHISVPHPQAGEAADFLEAFLAEEGSELLAQEGLLDDEYDDDDDDEYDDDNGVAASQRLSPALAGIVVLFCGLGHIYARRRVTGIALAVAFVITAFVLPFHVRPSSGVSIGIALFVLVLSDFIGTQLAVRAHNRGVRRGVLFQLGAVVVIVFITALASQIPKLAMPLGDAISTPRTISNQTFNGQPLDNPFVPLDLGPADPLPLPVP